jgi:hypothetical protein
MNIGTFAQAERTFASFEPKGVDSKDRESFNYESEELIECCSASLAMPRMSLMA